MTTKTKNSLRSYETEIERSREESNWKRAVELAQQLKTRSPQHESLAHFLIGEGKLEAYLEEWPPIKENTERAERELSEARGYLTLATDESGKKAGVALDAYLLLGKLNFACGNYEDSLNNYKMAELSTLTEKELPIRSLRIVAESFAIKGLCLEQTTLPGSTSKFKQAEKDSEMIRSFELSCSLSMVYMQRLPSSSAARPPPALESVLQRAPLLHIRNGRIHDAIDRYRDMLSAVECQSTQALRLTLAKQLAEVLMRGVTGQSYRPTGSTEHHTGSMGRKRDLHAEGPWKPKKYSGLNQFVPRNVQEETLLCLLVGEAMAVRDAVLSQSAEFAVQREHSVNAAIALIDLLAVAAVRYGQMCLLIESLERAMKFSFMVRHVWRARALATAASALNDLPPRLQTNTSHSSKWWNTCVNANAVMLRARQLNPEDASLRLVGANTCYNMGWVDEGLELAEEALSIEKENDGPLLARCYLFCGMGCYMKSQKPTISKIEKDACTSRCHSELTKSVQLDNNDYLSFYHLALYYCSQGMLNDAMECAVSSLRLCPSCSGALRVVSAVWSRCGRGEAVRAALLARDHHPLHTWPRVELARLQLLHTDPEAALATGKELLELVYSEDAEVDDYFNGYMELDTVSGSIHDDLGSHRDAVSVVAESVVDRALSESSTGRRARPTRTVARTQAWLLMAELYLKLDRITAAAGCVAEAAAISPYSHLVLYTRGLVHAASLEWEEARQCFMNALAINPTHLDSLVNLGTAYYELGWLRLSEKVLRSAASQCGSHPATWRRLSVVLGALGDHHAAADAAAAALHYHLRYQCEFQKLSNMPNKCTLS